MSNQERRLTQALNRLRPEVRRAFEQAIRDAAISVNQTLLANLIEQGRIEEAVELLRIDQSLFSPLTDALRGAFLTGGRLAEDIAPRGLTGVFRFDGRHPDAVAWVQRQAATLVQGIEQEELIKTRRVITAGIEEGMHSRRIAQSLTGRAVSGKRRVGGFLGLTAQQADSIIAGRAKLRSGDPALMRQYMRLEQRDKSMDSRIKRAIAEGRGITGKELDMIIEAHRSKALGYRGRVIASHETKNALAAGRERGMQQMLARPDVEAVTCRWQHSLSEHPRLAHVAMNGTVINLGERFEFPDGVAMKHPHDDEAPARHTIGCRCVGIYRVRMRKS